MILTLLKICHALILFLNNLLFQSYIVSLSGCCGMAEGRSKRVSCNACSSVGLEIQMKNLFTTRIDAIYKAMAPKILGRTAALVG